MLALVNMFILQMCLFFVFSELKREIMQKENELALLNDEITDLRNLKVALSLIILCFYTVGVYNHFRLRESRDPPLTLYKSCIAAPITQNYMHA